MSRRGRRTPPSGGRNGEHLELFAVSPEAPPAPAARRRKAPARADTPVVQAPPYEDSIPGASPRSAVSISTITHTLRDVLEGAFTPLWVRGEVSGLKAHRNGHWYFCLRDEETQLRCVVWSRDQRGIPAPPDEGMQVVALGQLTVYPARGELQFAVRAMEAQGDGLWRKAMALTLARLDKDGLLASDRKRPLPRFPQRIAIVTSPDGAAVQDVISVVRRRCATVEVVVVPAKVQGDGSVEELCAAMGRVSRWGGADMVIIGRGGGGREDLWAFNDERLARAVAGCPVPTISAVGHEIDTTICDLVADHRAATPSAAAEAAVPLLGDLAGELVEVRAALRAAIDRQISQSRQRLHRVARDVAASSTRCTTARRSTLKMLASRLDALSPLAILSRGYAVARDASGRTLASVKEFVAGQPFELKLRDGEVSAEVLSARRQTPPGTSP